MFQIFHYFKKENPKALPQLTRKQALMITDFKPF